MVRLASAASALSAAAALAACGGADDRPGVAWGEQPRVVVHPESATDRILTARVRNTGDEELRIDAEDVRLLDARDRPVRATVRFSRGYSHSLYPPRDAPRETPRQEAERLGAAATIRGNGSAPLTVGWNAHRGDPQPVRIDFGPTTLSVPGPR